MHTRDQFCNRQTFTNLSNVHQATMSANDTSDRQEIVKHIMSKEILTYLLLVDVEDNLKI